MCAYPDFRSPFLCIKWQMETLKKSIPMTTASFPVCFSPDFIFGLFCKIYAKNPHLLTSFIYLLYYFLLWNLTIQHRCCPYSDRIERGPEYLLFKQVYIFWVNNLTIPLSVFGVYVFQYFVESLMQLHCSKIILQVFLPCITFLICFSDSTQRPKFLCVLKKGSFGFIPAWNPLFVKSRCEFSCEWSGVAREKQI